MLIAADTHVHVYPFYDPSRLLRSLSQALDRAAGGRPHINVAFLAERAECDWFHDLKSGNAGASTAFGIEVLPSDPHAVKLEVDGAALYVVAGRQIRTAEGIEILSLGKDSSFTDGITAVKAVEAIRRAGAVPVVAWAPGKWSFARAAVVRGLLEAAKPGELLVGDSSTRPSTASVPALMREARRRGLAVIAGSDPLPVRGEEALAGSWCSLFECDFNPAEPSASLRSALSSPAMNPLAAGSRNGLVAMLVRQIRCRLGR